TNNSSGLVGNDDCGQMSAWYVFSALGFYPVNPASGDYDLGVPAVEHAVVHLPNGNTLEVKAPRKRADYTNPKEVRLNGKLLKDRKISHKDILAGGTLKFKMSK
ncbi:glycoside hydrolase domain-containing protein, partial [Xylanibacter muris]|uniref:glycoside hydrolase domain-containing protein n=1 Tax=Xylanibacter muris TaxID=2736290 RepID=UPI0025A1182A